MRDRLMITYCSLKIYNFLWILKIFKKLKNKKYSQFLKGSCIQSRTNSSFCSYNL